MKTTYTTTLGEIIEYPNPPPELAAFIGRAVEAAEDPRVSEDAMIALVYGPENPLLEQGKFKGRGAVTKEVLANPTYKVFLDLLQHKRIALGLVTPEQLKATFTMTVADAVAAIGSITHDGVQRAVRSGRLAGQKTPTGYLIDPRSVETFKAGRRPRGPTKGAALRLVFGSAPGKSFRAKFAGLEVKEKSSLPDGSKLQHAEVATFERGAICFSEKKPNGKTLNRCFILVPSRRASRYPEKGPFYVEGHFKVEETENDEAKAAATFSAFVPS